MYNLKHIEGTCLIFLLLGLHDQKSFETVVYVSYNHLFLLLALKA